MCSRCWYAPRREDGSPLSPRQIHDEALTLLLAGHETTALALSWTWYLLAQHPDVDATMQAELQTVLGGRLPTAEDLPQLRYTRMVFTEALRLYPPAWLMTRRAREEVVIGDYRFPPGTFFLLSPYLTHRDPRFFPDPEAFVPTRWAAPPDAGPARYAYLPFGGGPRQCLGEGFAWMEGLLVLTTLAQTWRMRAGPRPSRGALGAGDPATESRAFHCTSHDGDRSGRPGGMDEASQVRQALQDLSELSTASSAYPTGSLAPGRGQSLLRRIWKTSGSPHRTASQNRWAG